MSSANNQGNASRRRRSPRGTQRSRSRGRSLSRTDSPSDNQLERLLQLALTAERRVRLDEHDPDLAHESILAFFVNPTDDLRDNMDHGRANVKQEWILAGSKADVRLSPEYVSNTLHNKKNNFAAIFLHNKQYMGVCMGVLGNDRDAATGYVSGSLNPTPMTIAGSSCPAVLFLEIKALFCVPGHGGSMFELFIKQSYKVRSVVPAGSNLSHVQLTLSALPNVEGFYAKYGLNKVGQDPEHLTIMTRLLPLQNVAVSQLGLQSGPSDRSKSYRCNVITLGAIASGKSALIVRYATGKFDTSLTPTVGIDTKTVDLLMADGRWIQLIVHDTAGQERFASLAASYVKRAHAALLVCDPTDTECLTELRRAAQQLSSDHPHPDRCPVIVVASKADKEERVHRIDAIDQCVKELILARLLPSRTELMECSAKTGLGVRTCFTSLAKYAYKLMITDPDSPMAQDPINARLRSASASTSRLSAQVVPRLSSPIKLESSQAPHEEDDSGCC